MNLPLREAFLARLPTAFAGERFDVETGDNVVTFLAKHPDVGPLLVTVDDDEFILFVGMRAHAHFGVTTEGTPDERAALLVDEVVAFLQQDFADQIEIYGSGNGGGGGMCQRIDRPRGLLSRLLFGWRSYVWSGPLP
jgi:hypothetical protein